MSRNEIMDALMTVLEEMSSVKTFSRRFRDWGSVPQGTQMPYLMLSKPKEMYPPRVITSLPPKRTFMCDITIYISTGQDQNGEPDRVVCDLMDDLDEALRPPVGKEVQTLGGLVDHAYIEGNIDLVPGDLDGIGMMQIPVIIVVP